eukprot:NODE_12331_length_1231_cov_4.028080.p1 GENE.NODE_12331_length_1231_cov_4.028080~~NODE_12331_length_1231_cov_4.028080.p1  ORF type:complete len:190 (+),score=50.22 NODE_12331_length_1231_cov_4.028080:363-932(+)
MLWHGALVLTDEVIDHYGARLAAGARVIELGSGLGLPGMVCAALGARVLLTDVPDVADLLQRNVATNFGGDGGWCRAAPLDWDVASARSLLAESSGPFDLVLCSDCIYEPLYGQSWRALVDCLEVFCELPTTTVMISVTRRHVEHDGIERFLARASEVLSVERFCSRTAEDQHVEVYAIRRPAAPAVPP